MRSVFVNMQCRSAAAILNTQCWSMQKKRQCQWWWHVACRVWPVAVFLLPLARWQYWWLYFCWVWLTHWKERWLYVMTSPAKTFHFGDSIFTCQGLFIRFLLPSVSPCPWLALKWLQFVLSASKCVFKKSFIENLGKWYKHCSKT